MSDYSEIVHKFLTKNKIKIGDRVEIRRGEKKYEGILMPKSQGDANVLVLKMDSGYNIGIAFHENVKKLKAVEQKQEKPAKSVSVPRDRSKPTIAILHTGGTLASRLDYKTGGVVWQFSAEEILEMYPELKDIANIRSRLLFQMASEDMEPEHWQKMAQQVYREMAEEGCDGIIITQGTDTIHYTSAALAFMLRDLSIPVIIVGAQRSSDRGSSDAGMNLVCASRFIVDSDFSGVAVCMHATSSDDFCHILPACKNRKMHTSRRDAFRPMNGKPIAKVDYATGRIEYLTLGYKRKDMKRIPKLEDRFERNVALIKMYPGFKADDLNHLANRRGIVVEAFALGHMPINKWDEETRHHPELLTKVKELTHNGVFVIITSQCLYGRVNMNVYSPGRILLDAGAIQAFMLPEVAFVKLGWVLGHTRDPAEVKRLMETDIAGEIIERNEHDEFPDEGLER
ncbi:MAG: Glu-tRNA(Gln) amidotransferase subunit GatD [Candidatus Aenigmatarchaeota archaeon]